MAVVVGHQRIRHSETAGCIRCEYDAMTYGIVLCVPGEITDNAILYGQGFAVVEHDPVSAAKADPFDGQATQADFAVEAGIDRDAVEAAGHQRPRLAHAVIDDADALGDRYRAVAARVEHRYLAEGERVVMSPLKASARRGRLQSLASLPSDDTHVRASWA